MTTMNNPDFKGIDLIFIDEAAIKKYARIESVLAKNLRNSGRIAFLFFRSSEVLALKASNQHFYRRTKEPQLTATFNRDRERS